MNSYSDFDSGKERKGHLYDIKPRKLVSVNVDYKQTGVGGYDSWGAWPRACYRLTKKHYEYSFYLCPIRSGEDPFDKSSYRF
ncbi:hypothetical protein K4L44_02720 [Halosquirtibacter laminarini]|uniref:Uncharacterized protein n=1 Tax=Halosquirtibacter laminarini TaxID=3374600 RepID=A0AC61NLE9_9BACT|nr:hypothetical protein K4L44_02720 [Prolixibacteraceae bacterium]